MFLKPKICKCGKKTLPNRRICWTCHRARQKALREASVARQVARRRKKREKLTNSYRYLHKQAWKAFSKHVRQKGMDENGYNVCFTCNVKKQWNELQCGHFHHNRLDFSPLNCRPQCPRCNTYLSGNLGIYGTKLAEELGVEGIKKLRFDAENVKYSCTDLKNIIKQYDKGSNLSS